MTESSSVVKSRKRRGPWITAPCLAALEWIRNPQSRIFALRILVTLSLLIAAAICGTINYLTLSGNERQYAISQYNSITEQGLVSMVQRFARMNTGTLVLAKSYGFAFPDFKEWPNVAVNGFYETVPLLSEVSALDNMYFCPLVLGREQLDNFTEFAYNYWASQPNLPPFAGYSLAGRGIWSTDPRQTDLSKFFYLDKTGEVLTYESLYNNGTWFPVFQLTFSEDIGPNNLGLNSHSQEIFGVPGDIQRKCVNDSASYESAVSDCGSLSNLIPLPIPSPIDPFPTLTGLQAFITQPVVLRDPVDSTQGLFVGTVGGFFNWATLLSRTVPTYVEGIDCVISTGAVYFTYSIVEGESIFKGLGDSHDTDYDDLGRTVNLLEESTVAAFTPYQLTYYPRRSFFRNYETDNPLYSTIGAICIILFCSVIFILYDVSMQREATRKEVVLDTKRRFVRFISHEIRTPLNTVRLGLKLLEMELNGLANQLPNTSPSQMAGVVEEYISGWLQLADDVLGNSDSAVDVLNDLLNYDKIEMGTLRLEFSAFDIWALVKKTVSTFSMQAKQKGVEMRMLGECWSPSLPAESDYDLLKVVGDSMRVAQVLRNLISNALKFTPEQGSVTVKAEWIQNGLPDVDINITSDQANLLDEPRAGSIAVSVTDSGAGLSPEQLGQICSEGVQFNANQLQAGGGSGLGLFISKGMVEAHGGTLKVTSEGLEKGATFTMELPLFRLEDDVSMQMQSFRNKPMPPSPSSLASSKSSNKVVPINSNVTTAMGNPVNHKERMGGSVSSGPKRVLVVDDADSNRKMLMRILKAKGYLCEGAVNGQDAIEVYKSLLERADLVDAILMDFEMPVMDGPTATGKLRDMGCDCLIIGVTGNLLPADIDHFKEHGANTVLAKPLNTEAFEAHMRAHRSAAGKRAYAESTRSQDSHMKDPRMFHGGPVNDQMQMEELV